MSDLMKAILCLLLVSGIWLFKDYKSKAGRSFQGEAGKQLVMLQGAAPATGKPVILEFWGTQCGPCVAAIPHLNSLHAKFGPRVQFVAVTAEDAGTVKNFMKKQPMSYPVALDQSLEFFTAWKVKGLPALIYLDANHKEVWRGHSVELTDAKLAALLEK